MIRSITGGGDNLYGYVIGRPIRFIDPTGLIILPVGDSTGNNITFNVPVTYQGALANTYNIGTYETGVRRGWARDYGGGQTVTIEFIRYDPNACYGNGVNKILLYTTVGDFAVTDMDEESQYIPLNEFGLSSIPHEFGHLGDLRDHKDDKTGIPDPGYENDIMGNIHSAPQWGNVQAIILGGDR